MFLYRIIIIINTFYNMIILVYACMNELKFAFFPCPMMVFVCMHVPAGIDCFLLCVCAFLFIFLH